MHHKEIKAIIRKELKSEYPNWKRLSKKEKKRIAKMVLDEVLREYDFSQPIKTPLDDLLGIGNQMVTDGIMDLKEMATFIEQNNSNNLFKLNRFKRNPLYLKDEELRFIDNLLDDRVINRLLSYNGYTPSMRDIFPCHFLRAEVLKAVKYPEISYRKFCSKDYMGRDQKQNRTFIGLPVNRSKVIDHSQLSQFRSSLTFAQMMNLGVYILHHFFEYDFLGDSVVHCVDSTELAIDNQRLLASVEVKGQKIRIYDDIDCDCGKRRNKRDKSAYVVGYRMHTLTGINAKTGCSFPLFSVLAPANHHDSHFLGPLARLAKAMGIELRLISADEAYHDKDGDFYKETGINLVTPPGSKVSVPENVDLETMRVTFDEMCEIPMTYMGVENECHEFKCSASPGECLRSDICPQFRTIGLDGGYFQRILYGSDEVRQALDIRKNGERPFNLLKKREGLEPVRVRSQHGIMARCTFTTMATLLLEMADTRRKKKVKKEQMPLFNVG